MIDAPLLHGSRGASTQIALRLLASTVVVLLLATFLSRDAVRLLMPMLSAALTSVASDFRIVRFEFVEERGNASIAALALLDHTLVFGGRAIVPDGSSVIGVGTTVGTVVQPVCAALVLVLAWPARWTEMLLRLLLAAAPVTAVLLLDTPFSMAAWLWDVQLRTHDPGRASPLVWWNVFLNGGGRLALGLVAGALSIALARRWAGRPA